MFCCFWFRGVEGLGFKFCLTLLFLLRGGVGGGGDAGVGA